MRECQVYRHGAAARFLLRGAGLLLIFGACSDNDSPAVGAAATNTTATATTLPVVAPSVAIDPPTSTGTATPAPVDGAALLQQAIATTGASYHFNQTATVDGVVAVRVDGDRLPDGKRLTITGDGGLVSWVITSTGTWLKPEGGEWEADDSAPPTVDPIGALSEPTSVAVTSSDGTTVQLSVAVPLASLGLEGDGDAQLQVSVVSGALMTIIYSTMTSDGNVAVASTVFGPVVDPSPVVPPI